jgi:hypothetical protein
MNHGYMDDWNLVVHSVHRGVFYYLSTCVVTEKSKSHVFSEKSKSHVFSFDAIVMSK